MAARDVVVLNESANQLEAGQSGDTYSFPRVISSGTFQNSALGIEDSDASHTLTITTGSNLSANRDLTFNPGDAARTVTLNGNPTLNDWFDQNVKSTAGPTFAGVTSTGTINLSNSSAIQDAGTDAIKFDGSQNVKIPAGTLTIANGGDHFKVDGDALRSHFSIQNQASGQTSVIDLSAADGDGTDTVSFDLWGVGSPYSTTDRERLQIQYDNSSTEYHIESDAAGTGSHRPIVLRTSGSDTLRADTSNNVTVPSGSLTLSGGNLVVDANNISTDTTTGTKIGTGTSQKLGFFNATPVAQQTANASLTDNSGGTKDDTIASVGDTTSSDQSSVINNNFADVVQELNQIRTVLINLGLAA